MYILKWHKKVQKRSCPNRKKANHPPPELPHDLVIHRKVGSNIACDYWQ